MNTSVTAWSEANQRYLVAALAEVRLLLEQHAGRSQGDPEATEDMCKVKQAIEEAYAAMPSPSALETICQIFSLSPFERNVLLLCAGIELDGSFASLCVAAQGDSRRTYPTFSLALAAFPDAHWSALIPAAPLRYWRLIEIGSGGPLTTSSLKIDERILHYLAGVSQLDERLMGIIEPVSPPCDIVPSHDRVVDHIVQAWSKPDRSGALPVIQLCGNEISDKHDIAVSACVRLGLQLNAISAASLPVNVSEFETLIRLLEREAALVASALLLECHDMDVHDAAMPRVTRMAEQMRGVLILSTPQRVNKIRRPSITFDVARPSQSEQRALWLRAGEAAADKLNSQVEALVSQFDLSTHTIYEVSEGSLLRAASLNDIGVEFWDACRVQTRPHLDNLAQRIELSATWDNLVLPERQKTVLKEIAVHIRYRGRVYDAWGFAAKSSRGLGISALFEGASGTGKTMAAEVLANELRLDLYRIDLSQVVSKYIGETEKNLRQVFDAAEAGGAILLFDEADALFGKRSEVKDSHDRYANIEVSYLLQRMEAYRGLAILTTNMKSTLDTAFLRRIRFVVQFPFPDASYRAEIWKRIFPRETPTDGLDIGKLARLNIAGGNIRNIALNAAFLAANDGGAVRMGHILAAARSEYGKMEKPLSSAEISGWE